MKTKLNYLYQVILFKFYDRYRFHLAALLVILIGYFPVAFQLLSLKNDIVQLDLPVKYFISKEIHRGEIPIWMYSWALGFPLGHFFTWSLYNPVTLFFTTVFEYNLYTLHLEFLFYLLLGSAGMWKVSRGVLSLTQFASLIISVTYALSGITLSCAQFLAYIASIGVLPWVYYFFMRLLKCPRLYNSLSLSFFVFLLISWSYPAAAIICFYSLFALLVICFFATKRFKITIKGLLFLSLSAIITLILSLPLIYQTMQTLPLFSRPEQLPDKVNDFGYLELSSYLSFFSPLFNSTKNYTDTTFLFQNVHIGSLGFGVLISGILHISALGKFRNVCLFLIFSAFVALVLAGGESLFLKNVLDNILPGFKWFRFPSFFRLFFLLPVVLLIGIFIDTLWTNDGIQKRLRAICLAILLISSLINAYKLFDLSGLFSFPIDLYKEELGVILIFLTSVWCVTLFIYWSIKRHSNLTKLILVDLVMIALISLPVYAVGSYSIKEINQIILIDQSEKNKGIEVDNSQGSYTDKKGNTFNGLNIYTNTITASDQYIGPLYLKSFNRLSDSAYFNNLPSSIVFTDNESTIKMLNDSFENHTFSAIVNVNQVTKVNLFQLWHPFWKANIDSSKAAVLISEIGLPYILVPPGEHNVSFIFEDRLLNIFTYVFFICITLLILSIISIKIRSKNV